MGDCRLYHPQENTCGVCKDSFVALNIRGECINRTTQISNCSSYDNEGDCTGCL